MLAHFSKVLPFSIFPIEQWAREFGDYKITQTGNGWRFDRIIEGGRIMDSPRTHQTDDNGICGCGMYLSKKFRYCRHEKYLFIILNYFSCPKCSRRAGMRIEEQFELCDSEDGGFLICKACGEDLKQLGYPDTLTVSSYLPEWHGRYLEKEEVKLLTTMLKSSAKY